jgi:glutamate 5-kinase
VARLIDADLLIILSDIDGLYNCDPHTNTDACLIGTVAQIDQAVEASAGGAGSSRGTGGMHTKIMAARIATEAGLDTVIANGSQARVIDAILDGAEVGTLFLADPAARAARKANA